MPFLKKVIICCIGLFFNYEGICQMCKPVQDASESINYAITRYTVTDGLPSRNTTTVIKDKKGFMWVGTESGLCRFDGYTFKAFANKKGDSTSISNNFINALVEDGRGRLWIGTMDGLNMFDPATEKFTRFYHTAHKGSLSNNKVWSLLADSHGQIWAGTDDGFNQYIESDRSFKNYLPNATDRFAMKGKSVNAIVEDGPFLWLGNWGEGLNKFDTRTGKFYNYKQPFPPSEKNPNDIWAVCKDEHNKIWIGSYWKGLYLFDPAEGRFKYCPNVYNAHEPVFTLLNINHHTLLVGGNENFWWVNTLTNSWTKIDDLDNDPHGHAYQDRNGLIWISSKNGLSKIDRNQFKFNYFPLHQRQSEVTSLLTANNKLWMGSNKGLLIYDFKAGTAALLKHTSNPTSLGSDQIRKIYRDDAGNIWILTEFGFDEYDPRDGTFKHHYHHSPLGRLFNEDVFRDMLEINPGVYGLATDAGFKIYDSKTGKYTHYFNKANDNTSISNNHISCLLKDADNKIWIGTAGGGLNRFDPQTGKFKHYISNDRVKGSLCDNTIQSLFLDNRKNIWICTQDGLAKYVKGTDNFIAYTQDAGFPSNEFNDIVQDNYGDLWITTERGVSKFNPVTNKVANFDAADGVFVYSAIFKDPQGGIYLAGDKGFQYLDPAKISRNTEVPPVYISDFQIFNKQITPSAAGPVKESLSSVNKIVLDYHQSVFSIGFVALNFTLPQKNQYAYRLEGFDKKWNFVGAQHKATYTNLDPGTYTFYVKAANNDGVWNNTGRKVTIVITPPWYRTWYAYVCYLVALCLAVYIYIRYKEEQARLRYEIKLAHLQSEQEKELNEKKLSFFTNISHEFRTPLTLIINPLKELLYKEGDIDVSGLNVVYRNAKRLLSLVDQLLMFRKAEAGVEQLKVEQMNIIDLCREVFLCFSHQARLKNLHFDFVSDHDVINLFIDREKMEIVLFNLISNAMKFTPAGGHITFAVEGEEDGVVITIKDTGCGIPEGIGDKLYSRFYQEQQSNKKSKGGFGIGLFLVKSFVESHKGTINYHSIPDVGTVFNIRLLKGSAHFAQEVITHNPTVNSPLLEELIEDEMTANSFVEEANQMLSESDLNADLKSLLIIDDNKDFREYLKQIFKIDYRIFEAADGLTGLAMIKEVLPEIVISDVMMEGMSGIELCAMVKEDIEISHIPVILLTSSSSSEIKLKGLEGGADDYISKPFDKDILKARVAGILKSKNTLQKYFYNEITLNKNPHKISIEYKQFLESCIAIVEKHMNDPAFNLQLLASELNISQSSLYKKIKFISGQSASSFIRAIRLRKAANLFIHTDYNILETSGMVGINDIKYFREQFKKLFNMNPSQYIKKYRKTFKNDMVNHEV